MTDAPPAPARPDPNSKEGPPSGQPRGSGKGPDGRVIIKKYANRRLYNTASSSYVTLDHLAEMVRQEIDFVVYDAKTSEDITRPVLAQIIFDEESRGETLLPIKFLRQLIRMYGAQMQSFVPSYLEMSLDAFAKQQARAGPQWPGMFGGAQGYQAFEEQVRQNMALFDRAMKMFTPFGATSAPPEGPVAPPPPKADAGATPDPSAESLSELKRRIEDMQRQIERLATREG